MGLFARAPDGPLLTRHESRKLCARSGLPPRLLPQKFETDETRSRFGCRKERRAMNSARRNQNSIPLDRSRKSQVRLTQFNAVIPPTSAQFDFCETEARQILRRAAHLAKLRLYPNVPRHCMRQGRSISEVGFEVETYCPFLPPGSLRQIPGKLIETLFDLNQDNRSKPVFQRTVSAYIHRVDRANFVQFRDHLEKEIAIEFVDCMTRLGIFRGSLECVSGDPDKKSADRKLWK